MARNQILRLYIISLQKDFLKKDIVKFSVRMLITSVYLIDPLNKTGSWRMIESRDLRVCRGSLQMSIPSMMIFPANKQNTVFTFQVVLQPPTLLS